MGNRYLEGIWDPTIGISSEILEKLIVYLKVIGKIYYEYLKRYL